jgi:hypothetical protein
MFELTDTPAILTSVTPRTEVHGDDKVFAISLGLKLTGPNTLLDKLSPDLRHMLYKAKPADTPELDGIEASTPLLRCRGVDVVTFNGTLEGWTMAVDHGIDENDPIKVGGCRVDKFKVSPSEGGSVDLMFRIGSNDIDATEAGLLCSHLSQEIRITLTPPQKPREAIDGTTGHPGAQPGSTAEDLFAAGAGPEDESSEGGDPDIEDDEDAGPDLEDRLDNALAAADAEQRGAASKAALDAVGNPFGSREAELQAEAAASSSKRTARGREATKKALAAGMAAAQAAGTVQ